MKIVKFLLLGVFFTLFLFLSKIKGVLDFAICVGPLFAVSYFASNRPIKIPIKIIYISIMLATLGAYAIIISFANNFQELIWAFKFFKTILLLFSCFFVVDFIAKKTEINLDNCLIFAIWLHAVIVIACIVSEPFRDIVYSITGYIPRGPAWSRSPGLTISFNATSIVHITGLLLLLISRIPKWIKIVVFLTIFISLLFMGRLIFVTGMLLLLAWRLIYSKKSRLSFLAGIAFCIGAVFLFYFNVESDLTTPIGVFRANLYHLLNPILDRDHGIENYAQDSLSSHIYFSENLKVLLFGSSFSGHIGLIGGGGVTHSDIGLINVINAIGIPMSIVAYYCNIFFCFSKSPEVRRKCIFVVLLMLVLSLKETGLFESNAANLLFLLWASDLVNNQLNDKNQIFLNEELT